MSSFMSIAQEIPMTYSVRTRALAWRISGCLTHNPCIRCAGILAAYGVTTVVVPNTEYNPDWKASQIAAEQVMQSRNITLIKE